MEELLDILDESGRQTGGVVTKSEAHRRGLWHRGFHCWVCGKDASGEPYLLIQRRSETKDTWPGRLDITAAGHLTAGEEPLDGLREVEEELGLRVEPERLIPLGTRRVEQAIPGGCDREFHDVFLLVDTTPPERMRLQVEEVDALIRIGLDLAEALGEGESVPATEYAGGRTVPTRLYPSDLVPSSDDYLRRVAWAARRVLAGEEPGRIF